MKRHATIRQSLYEFVRGELEKDVQDRLEQHLQTCTKCRREVEQLRSAFASLPPTSHRASARCPDAYWESFPSRVERRISRTSKHPSILGSIQGGVQTLWRPRRTMAVAFSAAVAVVLLAVGVWFVRSDSGNGEGLELQPGPVLTTSSKQAVEEYLSSSRMLLVGITNIETESDEAIDLGIEKTAARSLIRQARFLSEQPLDERSQELIQELERILIELANLEETADLPEVEMIRTGVRQQNLLFKIRMAEHQLGR